MDSKTALEMVKSAKTLIASQQGSRVELEKHIARLCSLVEQAVVAIDVYQRRYDEDSVLLTNDMKMMTEAVDQIQNLRAKLAKLTETAKTSPPPPPSPTNHSNDTLPKRDAKGRFIKYGATTSAPKQPQPVVTSSKEVNPCIEVHPHKEVNPCTGCKTCNKFCK